MEHKKRRLSGIYELKTPPAQLEMRFTPKPDCTWCNKLTCFSGQRNAKESPYLRLPAEIRIMINGYAIGGTTIIARVQKDPNGDEKLVYDRITRGVYPFPIHEKDRKPNTDDSGAPGYKMYRDYYRHLLKHSKAIAPMHLVCRQLYKETAVLQFKVNDWAIWSGAWQSKFIRKLVVAQRKAMHTVWFGHPFFQWAVYLYFPNIKVNFLAQWRYKDRLLESGMPGGLATKFYYRSKAPPGYQNVMLVVEKYTRNEDARESSSNLVSRMVVTEDSFPDGVAVLSGLKSQVL